jgi:hypothetical protein
MSLSRPLRLECTGQCAAEARCNRFCWAGSYTCRSMGRKSFPTLVSKTLWELDGVFPVVACQSRRSLLVPLAEHCLRIAALPAA